MAGSNSLFKIQYFLSVNLLNSVKTFRKTQMCLLFFSEIPCFYMNGHRALSGAQETETFTKTFDIIAQKEPLTGPIEGLIEI